MIANLNFVSELTFKTSRSGGKGGQNVNKVSSKVELNFDVFNSTLIDNEQKRTILQKLDKRINKEGILQIIVQSERSQLLNKQIAIQKFYELIRKSFVQQKKRIATKPGIKIKRKGWRKRKKGRKENNSGEAYFKFVNTILFDCTSLPSTTKV